jgi:hypothetical protein
MARKFRHRKRRLTQFGHGARPTNALAHSDVFCGEFRPFTIMPLTSKPRGGSVPFIAAGALIVHGLVLRVCRITLRVRPRRLGFARLALKGDRFGRSVADPTSSREKLAASWQGVGAVLRPRPFLS